MTKYDNLTMGTEIYYTGDMANADGYGTITKVREPTRFAPVSYDIAMADAREMRGMTIKPAVWFVQAHVLGSSSLPREHAARRFKQRDKVRENDMRADMQPSMKVWAGTIAGYAMVGIQLLMDAHDGYTLLLGLGAFGIALWLLNNPTKFC